MARFQTIHRLRQLGLHFLENEERSELKGSPLFCGAAESVVPAFA
jgi:hypothetical protein